jgi:hypothetical protein
MIGRVNDPSRQPDLRSALDVASTILGLAGYAYALGGVVVWVRLTAAHLPADLTTTLLDPRLLLAVGLRTLGFAVVVLGIICFAAYFASKPGWTSRRHEWRQSLGKPGEASTLGEPAVRTIAGLNILALSIVLGLGVAAALRSALPAEWVVAAFVVAWLAAGAALAWFGAGALSGKANVAVTIVVVLAALFCEFPIAVLMVTVVVIALLGRAIAKLPRPRSLAEFLRSPLPWALGAVYAVVAFAFVATPPVGYPRAVVQTDQGEKIGGYLARSDDGVYLATCAADPRGRSSTERLVLVRQDTVRSITLGGKLYRFDSGDRPSLLAVLLRPFGVDLNPPVLRINLRPAEPVCDAEEQSDGAPNQGLGPGVFVDPRPERPRPPEAGDEPTVSKTTPAPLAELALKYQPTVLTSVVDRFWPVTVSSVLAERGKDGTRTCLVIDDRCRDRRPVLSDLTPTGSATDSLDYPASLANDPTQQFLSYTRGLGIDDDDASTWLSDPAKLNPWATSAVYFYYAGKVSGDKRYGALADGLLGLQYWFFYPYNYYPTVIQRQLMLASPLGAIRYSTDLHEGDWEHVTVLLDPATRQPKYLYLARHDVEGVLMAWNNTALAFDGEHPIVQAALGGHPTYTNACAGRPRRLLKNQSSDWVVCATGRYAFPAASTPLIDLSRASWACWPGHFGEATAKQRRLAALPESDPRRWQAKVIQVAGPQSPLMQSENAGVCQRGPQAAELAAPIGG